MFLLIYGIVVAFGQKQIGIARAICAAIGAKYGVESKLLLLPSGRIGIGHYCGLGSVNDVLFTPLLVAIAIQIALDVALCAVVVCC